VKIERKRKKNVTDNRLMARTRLSENQLHHA